MLKRYESFNNKKNMEFLSNSAFLLKEYENGNLLTTTFMNKHKYFNKLIEKISESLNETTEKSRWIFMMTMLNNDIIKLSKIFKNGVRSLELGEGEHMSWFIKSEGILLLVHCDDRGSTIEVLENISENEYVSSIFNLFEYVIVKKITMNMKINNKNLNK
jgi:hypothetical protein